MMKATLVLIMSAMALMTAGCSISGSSAPTTQSAAAQRDYDRLTGTWQLTRGVVNGTPVPASVARNTVLITDQTHSDFQRRAALGRIHRERLL